MVSTNLQTSSSPPTGILLANTGTPEAPTPEAVRKYLAEFLVDPRIVKLPRLLWLPILHLIILNTRPTRSAKLYQAIWSKQGSPLLHFSLAQAGALRRDLAGRLSPDIQLQVGMRYGKPSIHSALSALHTANVQRLVVFPLFPQYSNTTTGSIQDAVNLALKRLDWFPELRIIKSYFDHPAYINAQANRIKDYWREHGKPQRLLFSFHGIPKSYVRAGDPYPEQCKTSTSLLAGALGLKDDEWQLSFQSRFGPGAWLQPYTYKTLQDWAQNGIRNVQISAPGFSADCLETLSELAIEAKETFQQAGGGNLSYIPALNDREDHIRALVDILAFNMERWQFKTELATPPTTIPEIQKTHAKQTKLPADL